MNLSKPPLHLVQTHPAKVSLAKGILLLVFVLFLAGCAAGPGAAPPKPKAYKGIDAYREKSRQTQISLVDILSAEAEKFVMQGHYVDALFVYNQAFSEADEDEKKELIPALESALEKSPAETIERFSQISNIQLPEDLLLYWMGVNFGIEDKTDQALKYLEEFVSAYPEHPYAEDAGALIQIISQTAFDRMTIGCLLPLSGKYAVFGERTLKGIQMALDQLSENYGTRFRLVVEDTAADPDRAVSGVRQLAAKNAAAIIGPLLAVKEAGQEAERLKIPMIALTQKTDFPFMGEYLFANFINPEMQVQTLGQYLFEQLGIQKVAILYPNERYGIRYMNLFWDVVEQYGAEIVGVEEYDGTKTDFTEPIQKLTGEYYPVPEFLKPDETLLPENELEMPGAEGAVVPGRVDEGTEVISGNEIIDPKAASMAGSVEGAGDEIEGGPDPEAEEEKIQIDFEALFIPDSPSKVNLILPQLAFNDATGMYLVGTNLWHHKSLLKDARGYNRNAIITDGFFSRSNNLATKEFTTKYKALFEQDPKFLEAVAYDTTMLVFIAARQPQVNSRKTLKDALKAGFSFDGAAGKTIFDSDGMAHRNLFLMTIKRGRFVEISQ